MMIEGYCKLCEKFSSICNSHIIPKSFFQMMMEEGESHFFKVSLDPKLHGRKTAGQFAERLLCRDCELLIKLHEDYVIELFRTGAGAELSQNADCLMFRNLKYANLRLFQLSVLWRMSVSKQHLFEAVDLGPHEKVIQKMLLASDPGHPDLYPCLMTALYATEKQLRGVVQFIGQPEAGRVDGHRFYRIEFGSCIWSFIVSKHFDLKGRGRLDLVAKPDGTMAVPVRNLRDIRYLNTHFDQISRNSRLSTPRSESR